MSQKTPESSAPSPLAFPYAPDWPMMQAKDGEAWRWRDWAGLWLLLGVAGLSLLADLLLVPLTNVFKQRDWGAVWVYACAGVIVAQGGVLTVLLAWGPGPFLMRLALHWCLAFGAFTVWLIGLGIAEGPRDLSDATWIVGPALPLISLAAQAPLWIARQWCGWRLVNRETPSRPLLIRDLMVAMLLAGVSLSAARCVDGGRSIDQEFWLAWGIAIAISAGISTFALLPAGFCLLGVNQFTLGAVLTWSFAVLAVVALWAASLFFGPRLRLSAWDLTGTSIVILSFAAMLVLAALTARTWGYTLIYVRR